MEKYINDHKNLINILDEQKSLMFKYLQIKSLERGLLEYWIFRDSEPNSMTYHQLSLAVEFIHDHMPVKTNPRSSVLYSMQALYALDTLRVVLATDANNLSDIPEVEMYKNFFFKNTQPLYACV